MKAPPKKSSTDFTLSGNESRRELETDGTHPFVPEDSLAASAVSLSSSSSSFSIPVAAPLTPGRCFLSLDLFLPWTFFCIAWDLCRAWIVFFSWPLDTNFLEAFVALPMPQARNAQITKIGEWIAIFKVSHVIWHITFVLSPIAVFDWLDKMFQSIVAIANNRRLSSIEVSLNMLLLFLIFFLQTS